MDLDYVFRFMKHPFIRKTKRLYRQIHSKASANLKSEENVKETVSENGQTEYKSQKRHT